MSLLPLLALQMALVQPDTAIHLQLHFLPPAPATAEVRTRLADPVTADLWAIPAQDTVRHRAFIYSDGYTTRATIHRWTSWAMLPLFAAEYVVGQKLYQEGPESGLNDTHATIATAIGGLFAVNTVTGAWNLWEARKDPNGRTRRWIHGVAMMVAGAGFVATAATAPDGEGEAEGGDAGSADLHRTLAISSGSLAIASWLMMLVWKD